MQEFVFNAKVIANAPRFEIAGFNDAKNQKFLAGNNSNRKLLGCKELKIKVCSQPRENKANLEIVRELKKNLMPKPAF
jgi:uncharacterized protein YggU (UPF0235/DUF167 family)